MSARLGEVWVGTTAAIGDLLLGEAVGLSVSSGGFKTLPAWLEISLGVSGELLFMPPSLLEWLPEEHLGVDGARGRRSVLGDRMADIASRDARD